MHPRLLRFGRTLSLALIVVFGADAAYAEPNMVFVVRHAERAAEPAADPALSVDGQQRAAQLAEALAQAKITAIITTHFRRTKETAEPLAKKLGIQATEIGVRKNESAAHVPEVIAAIKKLNGAVLVIGHSNTVAQIVTALTDAPLLPLCETSYSHIFAVNLGAKSVAKLRVGSVSNADMKATDGCQ